LVKADIPGTREKYMKVRVENYENIYRYLGNGAGKKYNQSVMKEKVVDNIQSPVT